MRQGRLEEWKKYFNGIASKRVQKRKRHSYYWKDITAYCDYFSHESLSVLEVGCGTGELLHGLRAAKKTGIDFSSEMISIAKQQYPEINFIEMSAE